MKLIKELLKYKILKLASQGKKIIFMGTGLCIGKISISVRDHSCYIGKEIYNLDYSSVEELYDSLEYLRSIQNEKECEFINYLTS